VRERSERGRAARKRVPRSSHASFDARDAARDPVELLECQAQTRVAELVPIRYGRMLASPFAFFRGAAKIMAHDLAATPRSGIAAQCCGDAHLSNFGVFASPERRLVFDINDFDETLPGSWEWDVKRLGASLTVAAQDNSFPLKDQERVVLDTIASYRTAMATFATMRTLDVYYAHLDVETTLARFGSQLEPKVVRQTTKALAKARTRDSMSAFAKLTSEVDGRPRIRADRPLIVPIADLERGAGRPALLEQLRSLLAC
jgi:uncharacterized protein (DUF2252 family)